MSMNMNYRHEQKNITPIAEGTFNYDPVERVYR